MDRIHITVSDFRPRFRGGGYVMSHVTQTVLQARMIRLETESGKAGHGEFVTYPALDPVTVVAQENAALKELADMDVRDIPAFARSLRVKDVHLRGMAFGLETAHLDMIARSANVPLNALLGGCCSQSVSDYLSLSCGEPSEMAGRIAVEGRERDVIQIKLDGKTVAGDRERIDAVMDVLGASQTILIDFNGAMDVSTAVSVIESCNDDRIMWEEPCKVYEDNCAVAQKVSARILFDQCLNTPEMFTRAVADGVVQAACIKPALLGGVSVARMARDMCMDSGIAIRVDGPWCGPVATATSLHLAVGVPPNLLIAGCDLCEPFEDNEGWVHLRRLPGDRIAPLDGVGHGVVPDIQLGVQADVQAAS